MHEKNRCTANVTETPREASSIFTFWNTCIACAVFVGVVSHRTLAPFKFAVARRHRFDDNKNRNRKSPMKSRRQRLQQLHQCAPFASMIAIEALESRRLFSVAAQTPFTGKPADVFLGQTIQFENFDNGGEGIAFHDTDAANLGGVYRNTAVDIQSIPVGGNTLAFTKAGEWTEYSIVAGDHAYCDATLTYASLKGGGKFHLEIDGRNVTGPITVPSTGGWQTYKSIDLPHIEMTPGQHILRLALDANDATGFVGNFDSVHIDQILENMQVPFNPSHSPWSPNQIIQAEDFNTGGESFGYHDTELTNLGGAYRPGEGVDIEPATDTGGGFDVGYTRAGEFLSYTISTPQAGLFGLDVRLASLRAGGQFHIEIDGNNVASFNVPATGGWQTYTTLSTAKIIDLSAGQHSLKLVTDRNNSIGFVANFNWLKLRF